MKLHRSRQFIATVVTLVLLAGSFSFAGIARAEQVLDSMNSPVLVSLKTGLNTETSKHGDTFEAELKEGHRFKEATLPAGTVLKGKVHSVRESAPFLMPGNVRLDITDVVLPSGQAWHFENDGTTVRSAKVIHPDASTRRKTAKAMVPFSLISAADAIPLKYAADFSSWHILPISLVARMCLGAALEKTKKERAWHDKRDHFTRTRYAHGIVRGTGLTGAYGFFQTSPEPELAAGSVIPLNFSNNELSTLFNIK